LFFTLRERCKKTTATEKSKILLSSIRKVIAHGLDRYARGTRRANFVDMDQGRVLDLLPGRDGKEVKNFLQLHKEIQFVCRDRSSAYSAAVNEVIPSASQVTDRFHLIKNLSNSVYQLVKSEYTNLVKPLKSPPMQSDGRPDTGPKTGDASSKTTVNPILDKGAPSDFRKVVL